MANIRALEAVSEAVIHQLRSNMRPADFADELDPLLDPELQLDFRVFTSRDFASSPITNGVSLFLYRIFANGTQRLPPGPIGPDGQRRQTRLPVEMHFLLTVWAGEASLQHALAGWMMRVMEDSSLLPASVLTAVAPTVFRSDETLELSLAELSTENLLRIYEVLMPNVYQLSVPYVARVIHLESELPLRSGSGVEVQERQQRAARYSPRAMGEDAA